MRIIINADDCGLSEIVDKEIEYCIRHGLISSTTIMANMDDFEGARRLYDTYGNAVSFGWHMNLTEGEPLTKSQALLDYGYFVEEGGKVRMNGMAFWKRMHFPKTIQEDIKKELRAQIGKIRDCGIVVSHADGHQHIHTSTALLLVVPPLLQELKIDKCRRMRNCVSSPIGRTLRQLSMIGYKWQGIRMPDAFAPLRDYLANPKIYGGEGFLELMVHPGVSEAVNPKGAEEYAMLKSTDMSTLGARLATYREL